MENKEQRVPAIEALLDMIQLQQTTAQNFQSAGQPDNAKRFMAEAHKLAKKAIPYIPDANLRARLLSDEPMSEQEWEQLRGVIRAR